MSIRPLIRAVRPRTPDRPRRRIVEVTNHWRCTPEGNRREVLVREPDGRLVVRYLADEHPALVAYLDRAWAVAA